MESLRVNCRWGENWGQRGEVIPFSAEEGIIKPINFCSRSPIFAEPRLLRKNQHRIRADADICTDWHSIRGIGACHGVVAELTSEVIAVPLPVAVEAHSPPAGARKADRVTFITAVGEIRDDHDIVPRATVFPPM